MKIRRTELKDASAIQELYADDQTFGNTLHLPHTTLYDWEKRISLNHTDNTIYNYIVELEGEIVGNLDFEVNNHPRRRHTATFGIGVKARATGTGVGSLLLKTAVDLAQNWLNLKRIEIIVYCDNTEAISLYKKFGFKVEGNLNKYAVRNGSYVSAFCMAYLV